MIIYWLTCIKIFIKSYFQSKVGFDDELKRTFRVGLFDCEGLRVMAGYKYPMYMDYLRYELLARTRHLDIIYKMGLAPTMGSQKLIYRRPLHIWTKFTLTLQLMGYDDKWMYFVQKFIQDDQVKATGIVRLLVWKKDISLDLEEILKVMEVENPQAPPAWVLDLFKSDKEIIDGIT